VPTEVVCKWKTAYWSTTCECEEMQIRITNTNIIIIQIQLLNKTKEATSNNQFSDELGDALLSKNGDQFWKCRNAKFGSKQMKSQVIDGCSDDSNIAAKFASFFGAVANVNSVQKDYEFKTKFCNRIKNYEGDKTRCVLVVHDVGNCLNKMKTGKAAGIDGLTAEHVRFSHPPACCSVANHAF
jgi:hypothetical protein